MSLLFCAMRKCRVDRVCWAQGANAPQPRWCGLRQDRERKEKWDKEHQKPAQAELFGDLQR